MKPTHTSNFLKEIRESRGHAKARRNPFRWDNTLSAPQVDASQPSASLSRVPTARGTKTPEPTSDLPRTQTGHIDNAELKSDLISQLKARRNR